MGHIREQIYILRNLLHQKAKRSTSVDVNNRLMGRYVMELIKACERG